MSVVQKFIFDKEVDVIQYLFLDIVVAENVRYYLEWEDKYVFVV